MAVDMLAPEQQSDVCNRKREGLLLTGNGDPRKLLQASGDTPEHFFKHIYIAMSAGARPSSSRRGNNWTSILVYSDQPAARAGADCQKQKRSERSAYIRDFLRGNGGSTASVKEPLRSRASSIKAFRHKGKTFNAGLPTSRSLAVSSSGTAADDSSDEWNDETSFDISIAPAVEDATSTDERRKSTENSRASSSTSISSRGTSTSTKSRRKINSDGSKCVIDLEVYERYSRNVSIVCFAIKDCTDCTNSINDS